MNGGAALPLVAVLSACLAGAARADELSPREAAGEKLFLGGIAASGQPATALIGPESTAVSADAVPCAGCHGENGRGRPEGGTIPGDITWSHLTKPYGHRHGNSLWHPAFTEKSLAAAITQGIDPAGHRLDPAMPRYSLVKSDLAALVSYLKRLDTDTAGGIGEEVVRVGAVLPLDGRLADMGREIRAVLTAYFDEINAQGGIYNRKFELKVADFADDREETRRNVRRLLESERVFAMVGAFAPGMNQDIAELMDGAEVPTVGPSAPFPRDEAAGGRFGFYLYPGLGERARALLDHAAQSLALKSPRTALVHPGDPAFASLIAALRSQGRRYGWKAPADEAYTRGRFDAASVVRRLSLNKTDALFFLGSGEDLKALFAEARPKDWSPYVFLPAPIGWMDISSLPAETANRLFLAVPSLPADRSTEGIAALRHLREKHAVTGNHLGMEVDAYCAAQVLVQGLKRAGRDVSRRSLAAAIEGLHGFDTGLIPRLDFGPNRHVGIAGVHVLAMDAPSKGLKLVSGRLTPK
jgi:ABC-type branched-subunit amino acid transport system substrate-binding protein